MKTLLRPLCWLLGHRWRWLRWQPRWWATMLHLGCHVGGHRVCRRCGLEHDFTNPRDKLWGPIEPHPSPDHVCRD